MRKLNCICLICKKKFYARPAHLKIGQGKYCSYKCANIGKSTGSFFNCFTCGKRFYRSLSASKSKHGNLFCSKNCSASWSNTLRTGENHPNWLDGKGSYRIRAIKKYGLFCRNKENCPLKNITNLPRFMYEVDHKDGDKRNNKIENLQVLCIWCHRSKTIMSIKRFYITE